MRKLIFLKNTKSIQIGILLILLLEVDRITKELALKKMPENISILGNILKINFIKNTASAFGIAWFGWWSMALTIIMVGALAWLGWKSIQRHEKYNVVFLGMVFIGAISNGIDRLLYRGVIDFIELRYWPIFNFADIYIAIGGIMFLYMNIHNSEKITTKKI